MEEKQRRNAGALAVNGAVPIDNTDTAIDLLELMYRLLAKWKAILAAAIAGMVIAGLYTAYFVTPMYQATSTIYVLNRSDSAINMSDIQLGSALTQDYIAVFQKWEVHEIVIDSLDLPYSYSRMRNMLSVENATGTRMLDITITSASAEEAALLANEYARVGSEYIADVMATEKPNIMSTARVPSNPVSPNRTKNITVGFLAGAALACAVIAIIYLVDDKYKTADDIRKYAGLVTLAIVPVEGKRPAARKHSRRAS